MKTKVKEFLNSKDFSMSSEFAEKINEDLLVVIERATERASQNSRKTVFPRDL